MATTSGGNGDSVAERLFTDGFAFDFFQAVRLLERVDPERKPVGHEAAPAAEATRFRAHLALSFPASAIYEIEPKGPKATVPTMTVTFMGLTGPSGVLPRLYTEMLMRARDARGPERYVPRDWFDLFNHRFISLFYRAWTKYRFWLPYERGEYKNVDPDAFTDCLYSLIGLGNRSLRQRLRVAVPPEPDSQKPERVLARVDDLALIYFSGFLAHRPRCAISLERLLEDYFMVPVRVLEFQGQWFQLEKDNQSQVGAEPGNNALGMNVVVGERVWDIRSKIRIRLGPLTYDRFQSFLPDKAPVPQRKDFFKLMHLVRLYVGPELMVEVQLILKASEIPKCEMAPVPGKAPRLGWNTWLTRKPIRRDSDDVVFPGIEVTWVGG